MSALQRLRSCQAGSTAVEFAIISLVLALVAFGVLEFGRALNIRNQLSQAADYGARQILTNQLISDSALASSVRSAFSAASGTLLTVTVGTETVNGIAFRTIALSYPFTPVISSLSNAAISLRVARRTPVPSGAGG